MIDKNVVDFHNSNSRSIVTDLFDLIASLGVILISFPRSLARFSLPCFVFFLTRFCKKKNNEESVTSDTLVKVDMFIVMMIMMMIVREI